MHVFCFVFCLFCFLKEKGLVSSWFELLFVCFSGGGGVGGGGGGWWYATSNLLRGSYQGCTQFSLNHCL